MATDTAAAKADAFELDVDRYSGIESDQLRRMLADCLSRAVDGLRDAAAIVRVLEERGEDLSEFRGGLFNYLPRIAYGQVLPEVIVRFAGSAHLMSRIAQLPIPQQKRLGDGGMIDVVVRRGDHFDTRKMSPLSLGHEQIRQVFAGGFLRSVPEQIAYLEADSTPEPAFPSAKPTKVRADARTGTLRIGRHEIKADEALKAIGGMAPIDQAAEGKSRSVTLDADIVLKLEKIALGRNTSVKHLIRMAVLRVYGDD